MLADFLTIDEYINYLRSLDENEFVGDPTNRFDCPVMRYLKALDILPVGSFEIDYGAIRYDGRGFHDENLPDWVVEYVSRLEDLQDNLYDNPDVPEDAEGVLVSEALSLILEIKELEYQKRFN